MSLEETLDRMRLDPIFMGNVTAWEVLKAKPARYGEFPQELDERLVAVLRDLNMAPLYTHQAAAIGLALAGENVVIVTGTASGKTLCYNLPIIQTMLRDPDSRALYLFPTKALSQDQAAVMGEMLEKLGAPDQIRVRTYDGDTPTAQRRQIREDVRILISNPDMLHAGILPHHPRWVSLFENLKWIVLDELHVYRGIFGSNVSNLLRRLQRLCRFYGSDPQFVLTSATIANPKELAERIIEKPVRLIPSDLDGSPRAEKHIILYRPPVIDPALGIRRAYTLESTSIAERFLQKLFGEWAVWKNWVVRIGLMLLTFTLHSLSLAIFRSHSVPHAFDRVKTHGCVSSETHHGSWQSVQSTDPCQAQRACQNCLFGQMVQR